MVYLERYMKVYISLCLLHFLCFKFLFWYEVENAGKFEGLKFRRKKNEGDEKAIENRRIQKILGVSMLFFGI